MTPPADKRKLLEAAGYADEPEMAVCVAYITAQTALLNTEVAGMLAENEQRALHGDSPAFGEEGFYEVQKRFEKLIGPDAIKALFEKASPNA